MWPRVAETMLGLWLAISPFVFRHAETRFWVNDLTCAFLLCLFSLACHARSFGWWRALTAAVAVWLIVWGRLFSTPPLLPAQQNAMMVGLLVLMLTVIPNHASEPPLPWTTGAAGAQPTEGPQ